MCYSAQVVQLVRKFQRELGVRLDFSEAEKVFLRRLEEPSLNISRGYEANFEEIATDQGRRIQELIQTHRERLAARFEKDLFSQKTRLVTAERSLNLKETKKAREDVRIATHKIDTLGEKLSDLRRVQPKARDNRVFPMMYAGVIVRRDAENILVPMRYGCRPAGKPADFDKRFPGLYNARRDNLEKFWAEQFGHYHAVMVVDSFYENVPLHVKERRALRPGEAPQNLIVQFTPTPPQPMLIACVWSHWAGPSGPDINSLAAITDEPPADVLATGQDRCIINLNPNRIEEWLTPEKRSTAELQAILSDRAVSTFEHELLQAA